VTLRPWSLADAPEVARACDDPETARWLPVPSPYLLPDAETFVGVTVPNWAAHGARTALAVVDVSTNELLGSVGANTTESSSGRVEIGYWTAPWARGRGVASKAAALMADWAFAVLAVDRVELLADVDNHASQRAAQKAGFVREGVARRSRRDRTGAARDMVVFSRVAQ
ncbi:MAG: GCN5-related N-acetyltransferase, partial [Frankiales bacterium]|nr:GCN5-related N-acetyltransferase [Frankiales bacterium]